MIRPSIRASLSSDDVRQLTDLIDPWQAEMPRSETDQGPPETTDALLDDPRTKNGMLVDAALGVRPEIVFYVLVRHSMLETAIDDTEMADFTATLLVHFLSEKRAYRIDDDEEEEFRYLVDLAERAASCEGAHKFKVRAHIGHYALWLSGLYPDHLDYRCRTKGAPNLRYYVTMGQAGYRTAARSPAATTYGVAALYSRVARAFPMLRIALNRMSDRHLWGQGGDQVGQLLREVTFRVGRA